MIQKENKKIRKISKVADYAALKEYPRLQYLGIA